MQRSIVQLVGLLACALLAGCMSVRVEPLTSERFPSKPNAQDVEVLRLEPARPHLALARIIATSQSASEDALRGRVLDEARRLGADAVVLGKADVLESMGPSPLYQSTLSPAGASYNSYWGGWWSPFYLDPWSYVQGSADQEAWTMYLSGLAVKYVDAAGPGHGEAQEKREHGVR